MGCPTSVLWYNLRYKLWALPASVADGLNQVALSTYHDPAVCTTQPDYVCHLAIQSAPTHLTIYAPHLNIFANFGYVQSAAYDRLREEQANRGQIRGESAPNQLNQGQIRGESEPTQANKTWTNQRPPAVPHHVCLTERTTEQLTEMRLWNWKSICEKVG